MSVKCAHIWTPLIGATCVEGVQATGLSGSGYSTAGTNVLKTDLGWTGVHPQSTEMHSVFAEQWLVPVSFHSIMLWVFYTMSEHLLCCIAFDHMLCWFEPHVAQAGLEFAV